jgi:predicted RNA-binding protein YlqC (UPF0109 family)
MPMPDYLISLVKPLIKHHEDFTVVESQDAMGILLTVRMNNADMGAVLGRGGETAKAIRHLVRVAGIKQNARVSIKIHEPEDSFYKPKI